MEDRESAEWTVDDAPGDGNTRLDTGEERRRPTKGEAFLLRLLRGHTAVELVVMLGMKITGNPSRTGSAFAALVRCAVNVLNGFGDDCVCTQGGVTRH